MPNDITDKDSVLGTVKKLLGIERDYDVYDLDILVHINTAGMTLQQLGVTSESGIDVDGYDTIWTDLVIDVTRLPAVKTYISAYVKLVFDPPKSSFGLDALQKTITELEWRLRSEAETKDTHD